MSELILHHYPFSPFSEKIRAMLGYADLHWRSVTTKELPPRPLVEQLVGGYRKIPVAQIGADIFCDSHIIASEIAGLANLPELAPENCTPDSQAFTAFAEADAFFAFVMSAGGLPLYRKVIRSMSMLDVVRFIWDRFQIHRTATVEMIRFSEARNVAKMQLDKIEARLKQNFLFGDKPDHADFSAYHGPWIAFYLSEKNVPSAYPKVNAWMQKIRAFGEGVRTEISGEEAVDVAKLAQPREIMPADKADPLLGESVRVTPSDYAQTSTEGVLAGSTATRWILARKDKELGNIHVHFPKPGYQLSRC